MDAQAVVADNVKSVRDRIAEAAAAAGRPPDSIRLVAVTKYVSTDTARWVVSAGCHDLGESRPQTLWQKHDELAGEPVDWHLIGHLQTNKVRRTLKLPRLSLLQSVDRLSLLQRLEREAASLGRPIDILLEARVSPDRSKHGFELVELAEAVGRTLESSWINLRGLMTMASLQADETQTRREFSRLRERRDELATEFNATDSLAELSMGMSRDYPIGIECGATIVRVGSALFRGLPNR